ncbi:hypothetical protein SCLARK_00702 [Spiroplasma clarkii]|nr:hypothetical protein [Spiroplasma clarkii]ARU91360.1 hypothetical protein SCLARK_00702 [Spiroplasma clarkii]
MQNKLFYFEKKELNKHITNLEKKELEVIANKINLQFEEMDKLNINPFGLKVIIKPSTAITNTEYKPLLDIVDSNNKSIVDSISYGQRNLVALMFYLVELMELKNNFSKKQIFAVLDDVVDGSDLYSYFIIKWLIRKYIGKNDINLVILTHNYYFSNIYLQQTENKDYIKMFVLTNAKLIEIDHRIFNMSDNLLLLILLKLIPEIKLGDRELIIGSFIVILLKVIEVKLVEKLQWETSDFINYTDEIYKKFKSELNNEKYGELVSKFISLKDFIYYRWKNNLKELENKKIDILDLMGAAENCKVIENILRDFEEIVNNSKLDFNINFWDKNLNDESDFTLLNSLNIARTIIFSKTIEAINNQKGDVNIEMAKQISNYLRHSSNAISSPMMALNFEELVDRMKKYIKK